jgi:hypothetical protein
MQGHWQILCTREASRCTHQDKWYILRSLFMFTIYFESEHIFIYLNNKTNKRTKKHLINITIEVLYYFVVFHVELSDKLTYPSLLFICLLGLLFKLVSSSVVFSHSVCVSVEVSVSESVSGLCLYVLSCYLSSSQYQIRSCCWASYLRSNITEWKKTPKQGSTWARQTNIVRSDWRKKEA